MDRSDDSTQLTRKAMVDFQNFELEFMKLLLAEIMESEDREIGEIAAIQLHTKVVTKKLGLQDGQEILNKFIDQERNSMQCFYGVLDGVVPLRLLFTWYEVGSDNSEYHARKVVNAGFRRCHSTLLVKVCYSNHLFSDFTIETGLNLAFRIG